LLAVIDLAQVHHAALHHSLATHAAALHDAVVAVFFTVLLAPVRLQMHVWEQNARLPAT
jgi:hypothetical protein